MTVAAWNLTIFRLNLDIFLGIPGSLSGRGMKRNSAKSSSGVLISDTKSNEISSVDTRDFKFGLTDFCVCLIIGRRDE